MLSYLRQYGSTPLSVLPLSDVDRLVFAQLSYVDLSLAQRGTSLPQALSCARFNSSDSATAVRFAFQHKDDQALCALLAASSRYAAFTLVDYACVYAPQVESQFAALTLRLPCGALLIAFRGTDNTLAGWKEDVNMAFLPATPSQLTARDYVSHWAAGKNVLELCGHSKGGNLALYAAAACPEAVQQRIRCAVSFDGPGLTDALMASGGYARIADRMRVIMPRASLVGRLFAQPPSVMLVESRLFGTLQHYPYLWRINGTAFQQAESGALGAAILSSSVMGLLQRVPPQTRERFIEAVYEIISAAQAETVNDLLRHWSRSALAMARRLRQTDRATYKLFLQVLTAFWQAALSAVGDTLKRNDT